MLDAAFQFIGKFLVMCAKFIFSYLIDFLINCVVRGFAYLWMGPRCVVQGVAQQDRGILLKGAKGTAISLVVIGIFSIVFVLVV